MPCFAIIPKPKRTSLKNSLDFGSKTNIFLPLLINQAFGTTLLSRKNVLGIALSLRLVLLEKLQKMVNNTLFTTIFSNALMLLVYYDGLIIPKDAILLSSIHALHNDSARYPEPEKFVPERFLYDTNPMHKTSKNCLQNRDHFAFGWGSRACPGVYMVEKFLFDVIINLMSQCNIRPALTVEGDKLYPDIDNYIEAGVMAVPMDFKARFIERDSFK